MQPIRIGIKPSFNLVPAIDRVDELILLLVSSQFPEARTLIRKMPLEHLNKYNDRFGKLPIHIAIEKEDFETIELLLFKGVDLNLKNKFKFDAYSYLVKTNNIKIIKLVERYHPSKWGFSFDCLSFCHLVEHELL